MLLLGWSSLFAVSKSSHPLLQEIKQIVSMASNLRSTLLISYKMYDTGYTVMRYVS